MQPYWAHHSDNIWSSLEHADDSLHRELYNAIKARSSKYMFDPRFRAGIWDGWTHYYDLKTRQMLTGLVGFAKQLGFDIAERYHRTPEDTFEEPILKGITELTSYQLEALALVRAGRHRGIFDHVTSSGKTVSLGAILKMLPTKRALVTVPGCDLLTQTKEELQTMLGERVGALGCHCMDASQRITVAYVGFIRSNLKSPLVEQLAEDCEILCSDELQTVTPAIYPFYRRCTAFYRFGFSGSFYDNDPVRVFGTAAHFGTTINSVTDKELLATKRGVPPHFLFYTYPLPKTTEYGDFGQVYTKDIVNNERLNKYFCNLLHPYYDSAKTILILVKRIQHAHILKQILRELFMDSEQYTGQIDTEKRAALKSDFKDGKLPILIATEQTFGVGINIPRIEVLMNLGGGLSDDKTIQKYGRGLRAFTDKDSVTIIEPYIKGNRWFERHSRSRMNIANRYSTGKVQLIPFTG